MKTPTLEELLIKPQPITLSNGLVLYVRRLNQVERDMCTASARRASKDMRKKLLDKKSDEYQLLVADEIEELDEERLRSNWVSNRLVKRALSINRKSLENRDETYVPEPDGDDVMPAEIETYELEVEAVEEEREANALKAISASHRELTEEAAKLSIEELREEAEPIQIDTICTDLWTAEYVAQLIARGTFTDKLAAKPAFKTAEDVKRLDPSAWEALSAAHMGLIVDPEAIKN